MVEVIIDILSGRQFITDNNKNSTSTTSPIKVDAISDAAWELRMEMGGEENRPGYRSEGARRGIVEGTICWNFGLDFVCVLPQQ